jgi:nitrogen fixation/metabolism regulation signal transduction histidine kinase
MNGASKRSLPRRDGARLQRIALAVGAAGLATLAVGAAVAPARAFANLLVGAYLVLGLSVGGVVLLSLLAVAKAGWAVVLKRVFEGFGGFLPLAAILLNAEAAELLLQRPTVDLAELRDIIADIRRDDTRASEVIDRLRRLLRRRQLDFSPLSADALVADVVALVRSDAMARHVTLEYRSEPGLPMIRGDRVHLSQVVLNMVMNAMDAVAEQPPEKRKVTLRTRAVAAGGV